MAKTDTGASEAGIDVAVVERVAQMADVDEGALVDALVVLHAELIGRHSSFERTAEYVTVEGVRAYRIDRETFDDMLAEFSFDEDLAAAVQMAHTEQAKLLFARSVSSDDNFDADELGLVIGIDTAEQF